MACAASVVDGHLVIAAPGHDIPPPIEIVPDENFNPYAFVLSSNLHRRHLKNEQKRSIVKAVIRAQPDLTDRAIARMAGVDHKTVAKLRLALNGNGEIPISRQEATGRKARGRKPAKVAMAIDATTSPVVAHITDTPAAPAVTKPKPPAKPDFDIGQVLVAAQKALAVLHRPVSAPNYEAAREEIRHVINLLVAGKASKKTAAERAAA